MAQEFFPQRVLASEERSGHYGRASMDALRGKGQARGAPSIVCHRKASQSDQQVADNKWTFTMNPATW